MIPINHFVIHVDRDVPVEDVRQLCDDLEALVQVQSAGPYGAGPSLGEIAIGVGLVASTVAAVGKSLDIAETIRRWRTRTQQKGVATYVHITLGQLGEHSEQGIVDVEVATDEDVAIFITGRSVTVTSAALQPANLPESGRDKHLLDRDAVADSE